MWWAGGNIQNLVGSLSAYAKVPLLWGDFVTILWTNDPYASKTI